LHELFVRKLFNLLIFLLYLTLFQIHILNTM